MKKIFYSASLLAISSIALSSAIAAPVGSSRPEVQRNFEQLLKTKSCPGCDLAGVVMTRVDLHGADLEGANLAGAKLFLADLSGANLKNANLQGAALGGADLANTDLRGANLTGAVLEGAFLNTAIIDGTFTTVANGDDDEVSTGEKVHVPDESKSKPVPYTRGVVGNDAVRKPVIQEESVNKAINEEQENSETIIHSKKMVPMAAAVVPETAVKEHSVPAVTTVTDEKESSVPKVKDQAAGVDVGATDIPLADQAEKKVDTTAPSDPEMPVAELSEATDQTEDVVEVQQTVTVEEEIRTEEVDVGQGLVEYVEEREETVRIDEQVTIAAQQTGEAETGYLDPDIPSDATVEEIMAIPASQIKKLPQVNEAAAGKEDSSLPPKAVEEKASPSVSDMIAAIEEEAGIKTSGGDQPMYTVETPEEAIARQQRIIEDMLDKDRCVECDLTGADLSGENLKGADLERIILTNAKLIETDFREANLKGAVFQGADLRNADFREADLYRADFRGADLTGALFEEALVDSADFSGSIGLVLGEEKEEQ